MHLYIQEYLTFYTHNIHTNGIKNKEWTNTSQQLEICMFHEQAIYVRSTKMEKSFW